MFRLPFILVPPFISRCDQKAPYGIRNAYWILAVCTRSLCVHYNTHWNGKYCFVVNILTENRLDPMEFHVYH